MANVPHALFAGTTPAGRHELAAAIARARAGLFSVAAMSAMLNILMLAGSIYMMLVYDMVLPSRSVPSLIGLLIMLIMIFAFQATLDLIRTRTLSTIGSALDVDLAPRIGRLIEARSLRGQPGVDALQPVRDLDQIRAFLSSGGPGALIDLPWAIFFIVILSLFHIWLGVVTLAGALVLAGFAVVTDRKSKAPAQAATQIGGQRMAVADAVRRHAQTVRALGMGERMERQWVDASRHHLAAYQRLADVSATLGGGARVFRLLLQSLVLTVGALLVIDGKATGGVIFASSMLSARALAPIDQSIANWKFFIGARMGWARLSAALAEVPPDPVRTLLPAPARRLEIEALTLVPPGAARPALFDARFALNAGDAVCVIGPSASGKSTLARGLVGLLRPSTGKVTLDGAALDQWAPDLLGRHIGYVSQTVELFDGTIAQNIARFDPAARDEDIVAAARAAGCHDMILSLPQGYDTAIRSEGGQPSAGQRQRIALARAAYRDPFLIVLDEPNSNLDGEGEAALAAAIGAFRARGAVVVVVAHRPGVLDAVNLMLVLHDGRVRAFGPKSEVLPKLLGKAPLPGTPPIGPGGGMVQ